MSPALPDSNREFLFKNKKGGKELRRIIFLFFSSTAGKPKGITSLSFCYMEKIITKVQNKSRKEKPATIPALLSLLKELRKLGVTGKGDAGTQAVLCRNHNAGKKGVKNTDASELDRGLGQ